MEFAPGFHPGLHLPQSYSGPRKNKKKKTLLPLAFTPFDFRRKDPKLYQFL